MAAKSVLIAVGITAAALGHWTPFLLVCVVLSLAPQLIAFRDDFHYSAWLTDLWAQYALSWRRCLELLSNTAKSSRLILLEFHLDEQQRRIRTTLAENFHWITGRIGPLGHSQIPFMENLCQAEAQYVHFGAYTSPPNTKFIAPAQEILHELTIRQLSSVKLTVHDIVIIARLIGMQWTVLKPEEGIMSATGKNRLLYSTFEPSLGTVLHYITTGDADKHFIPPSAELGAADISIPTPQAAMLAFGILPGCKDLNLSDYHISSIDDIYTTLNHLDPTCRASQQVRDVRGICPESAYGFSDLIPMAAPMLRLRGSTIIRIPIPTQYCIGLTCNKPGFIVFRARLAAFINKQEGPVSEHISWVSKRLTALVAGYPEWEDEVLANQSANGRKLEFLESVHDCWDRTTEYFRALENHAFYAHLMAAHIKHAVNYWNDAWENIRERRTREHYGQRDWIAEGAHCYWDYLPSIAEELSGKCGVDGEIVKEAWIMMFFRAMCWWRCHWMMKGQEMVKDESRVPAKYWGSKQPVFLV